jgi:uncharacterized protein (TIGR03435 family)
MTRLVLVTAIAAAASVAAQGPASDALRFEVASIKPAPAEPTRVVGRPAPDRFYVPSTPLRALIRNAYDVADFQLLGGQAWMGTDRWEVSAKADRVATADERRIMLQRLLEERFALRTHRETRELPTYDLVLARGDGRLGPQMKPAAIDCAPFRTGQTPIADEPLTRQAVRVCTTTRQTFGAGRRTVYFTDIPLSQLARNLEARTNRIVVDKTGLTGRYDIELTFEDASALISPDQKPREAPPLPTALQEQLGLRLVPARGPVEMLVIDAVERPTPD